MQRLKTKVWTVDPDNPDLECLRQAAATLAAGGLVAFPTETVYGLGADGLNPVAVGGIFRAKGRPQDNPLILHVSSLEMAYSLMGDESERPRLEALAGAFWPGPLTMVVTKSEIVPEAVTGGLNTVGIRMPAHPVARALIEELGHPVAAPSANRSGVPSPTLPDHVLADLDGRIDGLVAGGACAVGVESTVLDITEEPPVLLRPGGVTPDELAHVLGGPVVVDKVVHVPVVDTDEPREVRSPGMKYRHYAPNTPLVLLEPGGDQLDRLRTVIDRRRQRGERVGLMLTDETAALGFSEPVIRMGSRQSPREIARRLFGLLREVDHLGVDVVIVEGIADEGVGLAVMNRLRRAAGERIT